MLCSEPREALPARTHSIQVTAPRSGCEDGSHRPGRTLSTRACWLCASRRVTPLYLSLLNHRKRIMMEPTPSKAVRRLAELTYSTVRRGLDQCLAPACAHITAGGGCWGGWGVGGCVTCFFLLISQHQPSKFRPITRQEMECSGLQASGHSHFCRNNSYFQGTKYLSSHLPGPQGGPSAWHTFFFFFF